MSRTSSLESLSASFKEWRSTKKFKERIPDELWAQAMETSRSHPLSNIARATGLDFYQLRARIDEFKKQQNSIAPINVTKIVGSREQSHMPLVEIETSTGTKVRFLDLSQGSIDKLCGMVMEKKMGLASSDKQLTIGSEKLKQKLEPEMRQTVERTQKLEMERTIKMSKGRGMSR